ncbi:transcriptional regulator, TetR family [Haloechinothrix alba]|uniref:Transcriptional regulator, TetR family n=2 Tax=Haloechinothrix alba TaxID=664784 RepID=A0A238XV83_9PSEU|nr:transcriptional regulator, TetR family [Haloechinothrix alba]
MDAGLDIIGTQGWSATTVRGVCEQARVGPRFFYESFDDLDALAAAVHDEIRDTALERALEAVAAAPDDVGAKIRAGIETIITDVTDDPRRARVAFAEAHGSVTLMHRRFTAMRTIAGVIVDQAHELLDLPSDSEHVVQAVAQLLTGGVTELVLVWINDGVAIDRTALIDISVEFTRTMLENLTDITEKVSGGAGEAPGTADSPDGPSETGNAPH